VVPVATLRALKMHGGSPKIMPSRDLDGEDGKGSGIRWDSVSSPLTSNPHERHHSWGLHQL
jgi:hypothetical protein